MTMTWIPSSSTPSTFSMISSHKLHSSGHEQILTAPEVRSQNHPHSDAVSTACYPNDVLLQSSEDYNTHYMQREAQYHVSAMPHNHIQGHYSQQPYQYRHTYQPTTTHQEFEASSYISMMSEITNQVVNSTIEMSASARGVPPPFRSRRTQSLEVHPTVSAMSMADAFPYGNYYSSGEVTYSSLPGSPSQSSLESSPAKQAQEPEFLPSLVVDGHPHPFFVPMVATSTRVEMPRTSSPTPSSSPSPAMSFSTSFQSQSALSSSSFSSASTCNSPSLSSASPRVNRKRFSTDSMASMSSADTQCHTACGSSTNTSTSTGPASKKAKQRYICHIPNCNRTFSRPYNLKSHGLTHDTHRPHACEKCAKSFARIHDRDRHMNSHMPQKPHVCIVCLGRFARQDAVIRHLKLSNETNACSWILKAHGISFRDAAAGRVTREALGDEEDIKQTLETLEEHARKARATRTLELMGAGAVAEAEQQRQNE